MGRTRGAALHPSRRNKATKPPPIMFMIMTEQLSLRASLCARSDTCTHTRLKSKHGYVPTCPGLGYNCKLTWMGVSLKLVGSVGRAISKDSIKEAMALSSSTIPMRMGSLFCACASTQDGMRPHSTRFTSCFFYGTRHCRTTLHSLAETVCQAVRSQQASPLTTTHMMGGGCPLTRTMMVGSRRTRFCVAASYTCAPWGLSQSARPSWAQM
eukprot:1085257-Pelagomonas_calceolata.AAC.3